ncbi:type II secretion system minor pseudopilin GspI [Pseudomonas sp. ITA]|uniref:type II secretion system minor pseudopilin GspI n=1 Tax=Pseudomonas sp. ITA TaxID=2825841 RepID=UPI00249753EE|nr:type II secretion system minor pseudopilin GspI [Pseudomonas sp. ITA]MDI2146185.1 type II secretion system minor pseudopilin GspI [Pseudomonas sp. ITA]
MDKIVRTKPKYVAQAGFTLIEVLVALTIVAVAMSAAVRVTGLAAQGSALLRDRSVALLAARSRMAQLRLEDGGHEGNRVVECDQGRLLLRCEQSIRATKNGTLLRIELRVLNRSHEAPPLAHLTTLLSR